MKLKKALIAIPLSLAILVPTATTEFGNAGVANAASQPSATTPAANFRDTLTQLLTAHGTYAIMAMRKGIQGNQKDFQGAADLLHQNTLDLQKAIASVYGDKAGQAFYKMWHAHVTYFVEYVQGTAQNDPKKKQDALNKLKNYRTEFSAFLSKATGNRMTSDAIAQNLQIHVNQLIGAFNAYNNGDYAKAYSLQHQARAHLADVAKGLSSAIVQQMPSKFDNTKAVTPAANLREQLALNLSGHASLAMEAMQNGIDGSKDFKASAAQLAKNTDMLTADIKSVYGQKAADQFKKMWSYHISQFVAYVQATAKNDKSGQQKALDNLKNYRQDFSKFIDTATNGKAPASAVSQILQVHVTQLINAFNEYHSKNYEKAYTTYGQAYDHMFKPAKALSSAIVMQFPSKFKSSMPSGMPKTDMGGTSGTNDVEIMAMILAAIAAITAAGAFMYRRKTNDVQ